MSEEELNQELSTDEIKDVSGGFEAKVGGKVQAKGKKKIDKITLDDSPPQSLETNDGYTDKSTP